MTATVLGKRKERTAQAEPPLSSEDAQAIFRRHFEAQFQPLPEVPGAPVTTHQQQQADDDDSDDYDDGGGDLYDGSEDYGNTEELEWLGISGDEANAPASQIEVVEHTSRAATTPLSSLSKRETKAYLSSRVPSSSTLASRSSPVAGKRSSAASGAAEEDSADLLKNDLALQRLLSESHLFAAPDLAAASVNDDASGAHRGRNRHLATDMRLASLGSRSSIYTQTKMPMAHRKGITAAAAQREAKRRRHARENNIILERPTGGSVAGKRLQKRRGESSRGKPVDAPAVGRLRDGMLRLSKQDIRDVQGGGSTRGGRGRKRRR